MLCLLKTECTVISIKSKYCGKHRKTLISWVSVSVLPKRISSPKKHLLTLVSQTCMAFSALFKHKRCLAEYLNLSSSHLRALSEEQTKLKLLFTENFVLCHKVDYCSYFLEPFLTLKSLTDFDSESQTVDVTQIWNHN